MTLQLECIKVKLFCHRKLIIFGTVTIWRDNGMHEQEQVNLGLTLANTFTFDQHVLDHSFSVRLKQNLFAFFSSSYNASADVAVFDTYSHVLVCSFGAQHSGTSWLRRSSCLIWRRWEVLGMDLGMDVLRAEWLSKIPMQVMMMKKMMKMTFVSAPSLTTS